jgi:hypothetical protein
VPANCCFSFNCAYENQKFVWKVGIAHVLNSLDKTEITQVKKRYYPWFDLLLYVAPESLSTKEEKCQLP